MPSGGGADVVQKRKGKYDWYFFSFFFGLGVERKERKNSFFSLAWRLGTRAVAVFVLMAESRKNTLVCFSLCFCFIARVSREEGRNVFVSLLIFVY